MTNVTNPSTPTPAVIPACALSVTDDAWCSGMVNIASVTFEISRFFLENVVYLRGENYCVAMFDIGEWYSHPSH